MPIEQTGFYWIATMAITLEFIGLYVSVDRYREGLASLEGLFAFGFAMALWGFFTISAFGYQIVTDGGVVLTRSSQGLALIGLLGVASTLVLLLDGAARAIKANV